VFERRKAVKAKTRRAEEPTGATEERPAEERLAEEHLAGQEVVDAREVLTLSTMCVCGHTRRDHTGLRMEVNGRCLECGCEVFRRAGEVPGSYEQMTERIRAALDQVERLQETVAGSRARVSDEGLGREEWLALRREFCGEEALQLTSVDVGESSDVNLDFAGAELPPSSPELRIRHSRCATIVTVERLALYVGAQDAMLVLALGDLPIQRWRVLWRGTLSTQGSPSLGPEQPS